MFAIRNGLRNASGLSGVISRTYTNSIVSAPPEVKISTAEKIVSLFCIAGSTLSIPMYMVPRFKKYGEKKSA